MAREKTTYVVFNRYPNDESLGDVEGMKVKTRSLNITVPTSTFGFYFFDRTDVKDDVNQSQVLSHGPVNSSPMYLLVKQQDFEASLQGGSLPDNIEFRMKLDSGCRAVKTRNGEWALYGGRLSSNIVILEADSRKQLWPKPKSLEADLGAKTL